MKSLTDYTKAATAELFNKTGAFFAFSNAQFDESKKAGVKYVQCGHGMICPEENVKALFEGLETIHEQGIKKDVSENGVQAIIEREYFNYESQISDTDDAKAALTDYQKLFPDLFTEAAIKEGFKNAFQLAVANDWF